MYPLASRARLLVEIFARMLLAMESSVISRSRKILLRRLLSTRQGFWLIVSDEPRPRSEQLDGQVLFAAVDQRLVDQRQGVSSAICRDRLSWVDCGPSPISSATARAPKAEMK